MFPGQAAFLLVMPLLVVGANTPSWSRYAPPLPHMYQMLGESEGSLANDDAALADDSGELEDRADETQLSRWPTGGDTATRQYKKAVTPVRFHESRMRPASLGIDSAGLPSNRRIDVVRGTQSPSADDKRKGGGGVEGLWMKKKKKRSRNVTIKKRDGGRLSAEDQRKLLGELGNILKDDDKKASVVTSNVKRQANASDLEGGKTEQATNSIEPTERQKFQDWLKQEYLRNMALSFATAKKKRSPEFKDEMRKKRKALASDDFQDFGGSTDRSSGLGREFYDPETLDAVKERLKVIENAVLADAIQKIILRARDDSVNEATNVATGSGGSQISNRLAEAYYIEKLKQTLDKLPHNWGKFREEEEQEGGDDSEAYQWKKRGNMNLADALPVMAPSDDKRNSEQLDYGMRGEDEEEFDVCPELQLLTSDCSALEGFLPNSPMTSTLKHFCNKHEVCYTCGEAFGLTSSDCDGLFLRDTMALCRASGLCHGDGELLLQPLHERRVFYKRSVPALCYRAPCIQSFLLEE